MLIQFRGHGYILQGKKKDTSEDVNKRRKRVPQVRDKRDIDKTGAVSSINSSQKSK